MITNVAAYGGDAIYFHRENRSEIIHNDNSMSSLKIKLGFLSHQDQDHISFFTSKFLKVFKQKKGDKDKKTLEEIR